MCEIAKLKNRNMLINKNLMYVQDEMMGYIRLNSLCKFTVTMIIKKSDMFFFSICTKGFFAKPMDKNTSIINYSTNSNPLQKQP